MDEPRIEHDDLRGEAIIAFLADHLAEMRSVSPPESTHALDLDGLRAPEITFWSAWSGSALAGCIALKALDACHGEIKSMRVAPARRGRGVATRLLGHLVGEARRRGYARLSLETGAMDFFAPARAMYARAGFRACPPFAGYREDPNSVFMMRLLDTAQPPRGEPW